MARYILSIIARDRSGIVGAVSQAVLELEGSIVSASQTVEEGYFAMILLCDFSAPVDSEQIVGQVHDRTGSALQVMVLPYEPPVAQVLDETQTFIITAVGPGKPGILHAVAAYLASKGINIDDLSCSVQEGNFVVICQVAVPGDLDIHMRQLDLESVGRSLGFTTHMQHENIFVATNELGLGSMKQTPPIPGGHSHKRGNPDTKIAGFVRLPENPTTKSRYVTPGRNPQHHWYAPERASRRPLRYSGH